MHADDADLGPGFLNGAGDAGDQAAATNGDHHSLQAIKLLQQFKPDGALPRDDQGIIERVDKRHVVGLAEARGFGASLVIIGTVKHDLGAKAASCLHLYQRRCEGHHNHRANTSACSVVSHTLRMVAGAGGDDAAAGLLRRQHGNAVQRSTLLEGSGHLQIFQLEEDALPG